MSPSVPSTRELKMWKTTTTTTSGWPFSAASALVAAAAAARTVARKRWEREKYSSSTPFVPLSPGIFRAVCAVWRTQGTPLREEARRGNRAAAAALAAKL